MTDGSDVAKIETLMMIDDNPIDQLIYKRLVKRSGVVGNLIQYTDAEEALSYLLSNTASMPDVILLDINMPGMNGFEFLNEATKMFGEVMSPVVIMLTTSLNPSDRQRADECKIVKDFLNKPLTLDLLRDVASSFAKNAFGDER